MGPFIPQTNPMASSSPQWAKWFDMLKTQAGGREIRMAPQPKTQEGGSNQFSGWSVQPSLRSLWPGGTTTPTTSTPGASMGNQEIFRPLKKKKYDAKYAQHDSPNTLYEF